MKKFWVQRPCFYWGYEEPATGPQLQTAWLVETWPPFYHGKAIRFRIRARAYHIGLCRKAKKPFVRPAVEQTTEYIRTWRSSNASE